MSVRHRRFARCAECGLDVARWEDAEAWWHLDGNVHHGHVARVVQEDSDAEVLRRILNSAYGTDAVHGLIAQALVEAGWHGPEGAPRVGTLGTADEVCHRCGGENVIWSAPSPLWNLVMRGNDINGEPLHGDLVCMRCFVVLAAAAGVDGRWRLTVDPEPDGLIRETPSGRVWDPEKWLWVDPPDARAVLARARYERGMHR